MVKSPTSHNTRKNQTSTVCSWRLDNWKMEIKGSNVEVWRTLAGILNEVLPTLTHHLHIYFAKGPIASIFPHRCGKAAWFLWRKTPTISQSPNHTAEAQVYNLVHCKLAQWPCMHGWWQSPPPAVADGSDFALTSSACPYQERVDVNLNSSIVCLICMTHRPGITLHEYIVFMYSYYLLLSCIFDWYKCTEHCFIKIYKVEALHARL